MNDPIDRLIDVLLCEELGGETPPDLVGRILARTRRRRRLRWGLAAAAAAALVAVGLWALLPGQYPKPTATGAFTVDTDSLQRGAILRTADQSADLGLGGYATVHVEPQSTVRIEGRERAEGVFLTRGGVACEVDSNVGTFAVRTELGTVRSMGTRFTVRLLKEKGDEEMMTRRMWVQVAVGVVVASGAWGNVALAAGQEARLPARAPKIPKTMITLSHVDETAEGRKSIGGSGHAVDFQVKDGAVWVEAIQVFATRYGAPQAPKEDFHIYVLDANKRVLADVPFPYASVERGELRWYTLRTPSVEVTPGFSVALAFNPARTKGVFLGYDDSVELSHSHTGLPNAGFREVTEKHDWMVRVVTSKKPTGKKGIIRLADRKAAEANLDLPPCVVKTEPENRATDVDPTLAEIKVTYDRPMAVGRNYSWIIHQAIGTYPGDKNGPEPRWENDGKTCVLSVKLKPDTLYAVGVNSFRHTGFHDPKGGVGVPYIWVFKTGKKKGGADF